MRQILLAAFFVVTWSSGFVGATLGHEAAAPAPLLMWRYIVTTVVLALLVMVTRQGPVLKRMTFRQVLEQVFLGILSQAVFLGGVFGAAASGLDAGLSSLICALQPMLVAAAGCVWFRDRLPARRWLGLGIGIAGVLLSLGGVGASGLGAMWLVLASLGALCAAALLERRWAPTLPVLVSLLVQAAAATVAFAGYALCTGSVAVAPSRALWESLAWLVLLSGLGGYASFILCLRNLGATRASALLYLTPPITTLWAWLMFQQVPTLLQLAGLCVVFAGVVLASSKRLETLPPQATAR